MQRSSSARSWPSQPLLILAFLPFSPCTCQHEAARYFIPSLISFKAHSVGSLQSLAVTACGFHRWHLQARVQRCVSSEILMLAGIGWPAKTAPRQGKLRPAATRQDEATPHHRRSAGRTPKLLPHSTGRISQDMLRAVCQLSIQETPAFGRSLAKYLAAAVQHNAKTPTCIVQAVPDLQLELPAGGASEFG